MAAMFFCCSGTEIEDGSRDFAVDVASIEHQDMVTLCSLSILFCSDQKTRADRGLGRV